jgi:phosphoglycolate phosphatase
LEEIKSYVGNGIEKLIERSIPQGSRNPEFYKCVQMFKENYSKNMCNKTKPYDGIIDMLCELQNNNFKIAVVSNKFDEAARKLCKKYFGNNIETVIGKSETIKEKPAPDGVLEAMKQLKSEKEKTIFVGDSEIDIKTAKNSGLKCVVVSWGFRGKNFLLNENPDCIVDTPFELLKLILISSVTSCNLH